MFPLRSYWPALLLLSQEAYCLHRLADPASLVDWRCSCLCSELIPSVTEKSVIFVQEPSFPQTAPIDDAFFLTGTRLERIGGRWVGPRLLAGWTGGCRIVWAVAGSLQC